MQRLSDSRRKSLFSPIFVREGVSVTTQKMSVNRQIVQRRVQTTWWGSRRVSEIPFVDYGIPVLPDIQMITDRQDKMDPLDAYFDTAIEKLESVMHLALREARFWSQGQAVLPTNTFETLFKSHKPNDSKTKRLILRSSFAIPTTK